MRRPRPLHPAQDGLPQRMPSSMISPRSSGRPSPRESLARQHSQRRQHHPFPPAPAGLPEDSSIVEIYPHAAASPRQ